MRAGAGRARACYRGLIYLFSRSRAGRFPHYATSILDMYSLSSILEYSLSEYTRYLHSSSVRRGRRCDSNHWVMHMCIFDICMLHFHDQANKTLICINNLKNYTWNRDVNKLYLIFRHAVLYANDFSTDSKPFRGTSHSFHL